MRTRQRGVVMIVVLGILVGVLTGVAIYAANQSDAVRTTANRSEQRRARMAAEAGIQYALSYLQTIADSPQDPVTLDGDWATLGNDGADYFVIGNESFRLQILDNASFLDINTIDEATLNNLPLTQEQIDSFLDWREAGNTTARAEGAKDDYYNNLSKPYNAREGLFQTVNELLMVRGWTPDTLYQIQSNTVNTGRTTNNNQPESPLSDILGLSCYSATTDPDGNGKVNINQQGLTDQQLSQRAQIPLQTATAIINAKNARANQQFDRLSQVIAVPGVQGNQQAIRGILDRMTTTAAPRIEGHVNINTAKAETLSYIPGVTQDIANQIVDNRPTDGYQQLSDLLSVSGDTTFLGAVADSMTVNTQSFLVRVEGKAGRMTVALEAVIAISNGAPTVVRVEQPSFANMPDRWSWQDEANETTLLEKQ